MDKVTKLDSYRVTKSESVLDQFLEELSTRFDEYIDYFLDDESFLLGESTLRIAGGISNHTKSPDFHPNKAILYLASNDKFVCLYSEELEEAFLPFLYGDPEDDEH